MGNIKYPVGEQSFLQLREGGDSFYVDKTKFIEKILDESKYYFLGRLADSANLFSCPP